MKYRKKPLIIEAMQVERKYFELLEDFVPKEFRGDYCSGEFAEDHCYMEIYSPNGDIIADEGDWIIKGIKGEFYSCKQDIFDLTYEKVEDTQL